jgi:hypothetical protein
VFRQVEEHHLHCSHWALFSSRALPALIRDQ